MPEIDFAHNREHRDLKENRVEPGALDRNIDAALIVIARGDRDVLPLQVEEAQKIDKVALEIAYAR